MSTQLTISEEELQLLKDIVNILNAISTSNTELQDLVQSLLAAIEIVVTSNESKYFGERNNFPESSIAIAILK